MGRQVTAEAFDCVQIKRRIQEEIYEETRGMKPDEFLAYIHKQVQESRFAAFFTGLARCRRCLTVAHFSRLPRQCGWVRRTRSIT